MLPIDFSLIVVVGVAVTVMTIVSKVIGLPHQIKKNFDRKSTEGVSLVVYVLSFSTYALWTLYGFLRGDLVVFLAHGALGCLVTGIILYQFFLYRKKIQ
ncbi:MAG: PQ-loop repeat-containing protein [Parcubacteria group bacterium]|nr:PQ-loop repeat-containing protein [Parcubacteria group bacterium]